MCIRDRGCKLFVTSDDKIILMTKSGILKKLPANFRKGAAFDSPEPLCLAEVASKANKTKYLAVWKRDGYIWASTIDGSLLSRTTSKGKRWLPEGSELIIFGTVNVTLKCKGRTRDKKLSVKTVKPRPVGSVGNKIMKEDLWLKE